MTGPAERRGLEVDGVTVRFGALAAVDGASLAVAPGEVAALVGPSGCGKSTLLRVVTGLEHADAGEVRWDGRPVTTRPPHRRGFGLMFQDHALFPHRTVGENVAFGLRMQGRDAAGRRARVAEVLDLVGLHGFDDRSPATLSGGEAQRVALARALAPEPRLLLLDEPLGSLDRVLRDRLAVDLRAVLRAARVAAVHVTHDQEEAYAVADRLAVMRAGRIERDGPAAEVWHEPGTVATARFLGHENVLAPAEARALRVGDGSSPVLVHEAALSLVAAGAGEGGVPAEVVDVRFRGPTSHVVLRARPGEGPPVALALHTASPPAPGRDVGVVVDPAHVVALQP